MVKIEVKVVSISELSDPGIHVHYSTYCHVYFIIDEGTFRLECSDGTYR